MHCDILVLEPCSSFILLCVPIVGILVLCIIIVDIRGLQSFGEALGADVNIMRSLFGMECSLEGLGGHVGVLEGLCALPLNYFY